MGWWLAIYKLVSNLSFFQQDIFRFGDSDLPAAEASCICKEEITVEIQRFGVYVCPYYHNDVGWMDAKDFVGYDFEGSVDECVWHERIFCLAAWLDDQHPLDTRKQSDAGGSCLLNESADGFFILNSWLIQYITDVVATKLHSKDRNPKLPTVHKETSLIVSVLFRGPQRPGRLFLQSDPATNFILTAWRRIWICFMMLATKAFPINNFSTSYLNKGHCHAFCCMPNKEISTLVRNRLSMFPSQKRNINIWATLHLCWCPCTCLSVCVLHKEFMWSSKCLPLTQMSGEDETGHKLGVTQKLTTKQTILDSWQTSQSSLNNIISEMNDKISSHSYLNSMLVANFVGNCRQC